ncbi:hypothetical protein EDC30_104262 [Paucimonas lemoignei]|uniref:Deoxynucleotide monophosphate kinase n=1 Tax=Paucimonas lemoignei TaxID=29443 RepID=A0A4R3HWG3_PAULE|nr:deoxynucleotide monophosphate kinase [Paucimonas lemoignei]TCS37458.1 hypothetical protein EDC30_104262 [Paucimonas lemoignei]
MLKLPRLIGITGKAGAGKDTIGYHLRRNYQYMPVGFADPIRHGIAAMLDIDPMHFAHPYKEQVLPEIGKSPRQLMQTLGTEWGRQLVHPDLWLIVARNAINSHWAVSKNVVITDVRFENEAALIRSLGGAIWHIQRDSAGTAHQHVSESGVAFEPGVDKLVDNNGSFDDLFEQIDGAFA